MTFPIQNSTGTEYEDVLERLVQGRWLPGDPKALAPDYSCAYLLENHEEQQHEGHYCQQASGHGSDPEGENRAVDEVCRMDAGFASHSETIFFFSLESS